MTAEKKRYLPTFYFTVNSLFLLLILGVGGILTWHNYRATRKIVLAGAEETYDQVSREVASDFVKTYQPVFQTVTLLSLSGITGADTLEERLSSLEMFRAALRSQSEMTALQVGYENGDYFIVRSLRSDRTRDLFQAPDDAAFVVDNIAAGRGEEKRLLVRLFFDDRLREVLRQAPEDTDYDPRVRPWYRQALETDTASATFPYYFFFLREVGTTVSYRSPGKKAVLGADVTLGQLSETVGRHVITPRSEVVLLDGEDRVWAYQNREKVVVRLEDNQARIAGLSELGSGVLSFMAANVKLEPGPLEFRHGGEPWQGFMRPITVSEKGERGAFLLMVSPRRELLADAIRMFKQSLLVTLVIILLAIPVASLVAAVISRALHRLAGEADAISRFDFDSPITVQSRIREVDNLAGSMDLMKTTISRFLSLIRSLASEQNFDAMLELITEEIVKVSGADGALTWLFNEEKNTLDPGALFERDREHIDVKDLPGLSLDAEHELFKAARGKGLRQVRLLRKRDVGLEALFGIFDSDALLATAMPLLNRQEEIIGLLCLLNRAPGEGSGEEKTDERIDFVKTFSGFAAVSLESRQLLEMQKRLMDSFMHLLAGAIDAKSPYTGGHCQRVPIITKMIARAACEDNGTYKDYQLDDEAWEAIHIASWLHDCGKVTTPEYVVDKATKLETINDRIHELRTRFEVLKRDAEIRFWEKVYAGGEKAALRSDLEREWQGIDDDFAFVAGCNLGDDPMTPERVERLEEIAGRTWKRTLDDRLGISWEEENRKAGVPKPELPVEEPLIADRPDHLIERMKRERMRPDNPWGFKLDVPEHMYNRGELYNLKVGRGTLNDEERFKINDHIVQTIIMLSKLPYPKHLKKTPEIAGGHHEMMNGKGYPKRLTGDQMSITARMMAIADIFEAITASDRPYKKAKKLSDTIRIMNFMKKDGHLDPDLFELFLRSGVHLEYGRKYLHPDQVDEVDIDAYLS
jgi:HD-GYP domain-containing protein (c-di-GMP phosphodiesterase class II)